jgi:ketosteroid isomerase-like protein
VTEGKASTRMTKDELLLCYKSLGEGDVTPLGQWLDQDCVLEFPGSRFGGSYQGARRVLVFLRQNQRLFSGGLKFTVEWATVADGRAVVQWTNQGITRTGVDYQNRGVTVFELRDDRIVRIHDYLDTERLSQTWQR